MNYIPIIKTTYSELKGYSSLLDIDKERILPLFELTKDRSHKTLYPEGRLEKAVEKAMNAQSSFSPLILDITSHETLINSEIEKLFDSTNGYDNWCQFIKSAQSNFSSNIIYPTIQVDADALLDTESEVEIANLEKQVSTLSDSFHKVAIRLPYDFSPEDISKILSPINAALKQSNQLIIIVDCGFVKVKNSLAYIKTLRGVLNAIQNTISKEFFTFVAASSFPKSVTESNYGGEQEGSFDLEEVLLHTNLASLSTELNIKILYSDYASIHPIRYNASGGSWIPRVDAPLKQELFYTRHRREDGGYITAAKKIIKDERFLDIQPCWGRSEIEKAAANKPSGKSPSHWIAVRANIHLTTQLQRVMGSL